MLRRSLREVKKPLFLSANLLRRLTPFWGFISRATSETIIARPQDFLKRFVPQNHYPLSKTKRPHLP